MNPRLLATVKGILTVLSRADGRAQLDTVIHGELNTEVSPHATASEFDAAMAHADRARWIRSARDAAGRNRWQITPEGQNALADL